MLANWHRADEGDGPDIRVSEQAVDHLAGAVQHLQYALGRAGFDKQLSQAVGRQRVLFGGLENKGVAGGDGQGKHPQRNHRREVERGNADAYAQRLNPAGGVDVAGHVFHGLAHHQAGDVAGLFHHLDTAPHIALGIGQGLAGFASENFRQLVVMLFEQVLIAQHHPRPVGHRHFAPGEEGCFGTGNCCFDFLGGGFGGQRQHFLGRRVGDFDKFTCAAFAPFTVDQLWDCLGHAFLRRASAWARLLFCPCYSRLARLCGLTILACR